MSMSSKACANVLDLLLVFFHETEMLRLCMPNIDMYERMEREAKQCRQSEEATDGDDEGSLICLEIVVCDATHVLRLICDNVLSITWRYAFSVRRRSCRQRDACGDFVNLKICRPSPSKVLI